VEGAAGGEDFAHRRHHVLDLEWQPQRLMAHAAPGGIGHFAILQVVARLREQLVIAAMVVMQMADDDSLDRLWRDAERNQPLAHRLDHLALAFSTHRLIKAGVDDDRARRSHNRPDEKIERLQHVVRVTVDEIGRRAAGMVAILDGVDFVDVVAHLSPGMQRKAYAR